MAQRRSGITTHTVAQLQALTTIVPQLGDVVMVSDLGNALFKYVPGTGTDDGLYTLVQTIDTTDYVWVRQGISLVGSFTVAISALPDNSEDTFEVTATGVKRNGLYIAVATAGEPNSANGIADYERVRASADDKLAFVVRNNTGAVLNAGNMTVSVYAVGG